MKYKIIKSDNYIKLEKIITEMIASGGLPLDGIAVSNNYDHTQAMTTNNMSPSKWDNYSGE